MHCQLEYITTATGTNFTGSIAQNSMHAIVSMDYPQAWGLNELYDMVIEAITLQSDQNLDWEVWLWSSSGANDTTLDDDAFVDQFNFPAPTGVRIAGAGQYYYNCPVNNRRVPYRDADNSSRVHIGLVNRSATAKLAGATGEVKIRLAVRPIWGG